MNETFTWIPLYREIADRLLAWEHRQPELIAMLETLRAKDVRVTPLKDRDADGVPFLLKEIDPFTFFASFNRGIRDKERLAILAGVKNLLGASEKLPDDFSGIPTVNNQRSWFIAYQFKRKVDDVARLWRVFRLALTDKPLENVEFAEAFDRALEVWGVATNLTMGLFWIRPETFLNLDQTNCSYLGIDLPPGGLSAAFYIDTVRKLSSQGKSLAAVSYDAWIFKKTGKPLVKPPLPPENNYWLVGAYWGGNDPPDQTARFLEDAIWQNGYEDRYLDIVKSMKVGDRIAIKSSYTQKNNLPFDARGKTVSRMTIKAQGTIVANRNDGRTVEVEWETPSTPKDWYFFTNQQTIWRLRREPDYEHKQYSEKLIDFLWRGVPQDYQWFCAKWWGDGDTLPVTDAKEPFSIDDMTAAGVFLTAAEIDHMIERLESKKNVILQGAPGVGKTFVARMLAYVLMKERDPTRVQFVQFHQTYSYEDFVRGYRPLPEAGGTFGLQDAVFFKFCKAAEADRDRDYVFIIDEINRGNLSQIFGELLMLIEADKRGSDHAIELVYTRPNESRFSVPPNVHIIGLMNLADRSLAVVDYALRRRFSFVTLSPKYDNSLFSNWLLDRGMESALVNLIVQRLSGLNQEIRDDPLLGDNYQIGHSFFCPKGEDFSGLSRAWYETVVQTEIVPLLKEYWFDNGKRAEQASARLLAQ